MQPLAALLLSAIMAQAGLDGHVNLGTVASTFPSDKLLAKCTIDCATDCLISLRHDLRRSKTVFLACDKGNKKRVEHLAKALSWWCKDEERVKWICLDADGSGSSSIEVAVAIKSSCQQKMGSSIKEFRGQTTDSGGGGVLESLANELMTHGLVHCPSGDMDSLSDYLVAPCALHAWQNAFANGVKAAFGGEGGIGKRCLAQALFLCYDLQQHLGLDFYRFWKLANPDWVNPNDDVTDKESNVKKISCPITTRW